MRPVFNSPLDPFEVVPLERTRYPGLSHGDSAILAKHLALFRSKTVQLWTSVPCGSCPDDLSGATPTDPCCPTASRYFKRLDAVLGLTAGLLLAEVKPSAGYRALGQILTYRHLFRVQWPELRSASAAILTDAADPDILELAGELGIQIHSFPGAVFAPLGMPG